ncbi:tRNA (guanosine(37)-N1)-methyltransferase TrmD [Candidatus Bealeia paramacronuclearis]
MPWKATVLTLFPEMFPGPLGHTLLGKALEKGIWELEAVDIRDFAQDKHQTVDDTCFGGGPGMVMRPDIVDAALSSVAQKSRDRVIYLSPRGRVFDQNLAHEFAHETKPFVFLCGRYEGIDQRVLDAWNVEEVSLGDFILTGGELAAMVMIEASVRLLPGVVGDQESLEEESFSSGLLEYPHYTRPRMWEGQDVPEILLSGHHENIRKWRLAESQRITQQKRPDLWKKYEERAI